MPIQICSGKTGPGLREAVRHGTNRFPLACYADDMTLFSVPWHWHEEFECVVAVEGRIRLGVEGERFLLEQARMVAKVNAPTGADVTAIARKSGGGLRRVYTEIEKLKMQKA